MTTYAPLHVHTQYSLLEGLSKNKALIQRANELELPAMAITDTGNIYGAVDFYTGCKASNITPIIGSEIAVIEGDITDRNSRKTTNQVVLLAQNQIGYQNLVKLISTAHLDGFYYRPRINWDLLEAHSDGLMLLTDMMSGPIGYHVLRGHMEVARERVRWLKERFDDRLYIELQDHGLGPEMQITAEAVKIAKELDLKCVLTNDSRYTVPSEESALDILLCMQTGQTVHDPNRRKKLGPGYYLKSYEEMASLCPHLDRTQVEEALANTLEVGGRVDFDWKMGESILPHYPLPEGQTEESYLREVVEEHARWRYDGTITPPVQERLDYELGIINQMGFPAYFLITWDFINHARKEGVPVGPGRGSAAGSLVAYCLGITNLDPLEHNLLFERFLNPERVTMPDVDIDFCIERRGEVIDYVSQRYGKEKVCQIATFGTLAAKAAVKAVARVLDIPYAESDRIAKMIPGTPGTKLADALEEGMELTKEVETNEEVAKWIDIAKSLEGTACNVGTHAAGVVIAKDPLTDVIAVQHSKDGQVISQFTMGDLEKLGLLKMDFLGLRNLTIIHNTISLIEQVHGIKLDMDKLPLGDVPVYDLLSAGDTDGVFQLESSGMKALVKDLKPSQFEDINALVALYRPGPLNSGMVKTFVDRKHGRQEVTFPHPDLEDVLEPTYGTIVYQEQIMQIAQILAGYSLGQADLLRRAMGKKKADVMEREREGFLAGCQKNGVDEGLANDLFDTMSEFAAYCFNRSHSAAYAFVAFQTAYLKAHYPVEYLAALLSSVRDNLDKIQHYLVAARAMDIPVLPPDVQTSLVDFSPSQTTIAEEETSAIRFGLASVKNVGVGAVESILKARQEGVFKTLEDFLERVDVKVLNRKTLESLVQCGAFDSFGFKRKHLFDNIEELTAYAQRCLQKQETGQASLFDLMSGSNDEEDSTNFSGVMLQGDASEEYAEDELQPLEKALLGFYVSSHPLDSLRGKLGLLTTHTIEQLPDTKDGTEVTIGGLVSDASRRMSRNNKPLLIGSMEDFTGSTEFIAFSRTIDEVEPILQAGKKVLLKAKLSFRGDEGQFSLIVNGARVIEDERPYEMSFDEPPSFERLVQLGGQLRQISGDTPVVLTFADGTRLKLPQRFWVEREKILELNLQTLL